MLFAHVNHQHLTPGIDEFASKSGTDRPGADDENVCQFRLAKAIRRVLLGRHVESGC